jgi:hypothetical protein
LEYFIKTWFVNITPLESTDIVSTILFGDADEDAVAAETSNGMLIDYITDDYSVLKYACLALDAKALKETTIKDIMDMLQLFQIYPYFDANGKLRFEHIRYFIAKLENNAPLFAINAYEQNYSYRATEIPISEFLEMMSGGSNDTASQDWYDLKIIYSNVRNRPDMLEEKYSFNEIYSNAQYFSDNETDISSFKALFACYANLVMDGWVNVDMGTFSADRHYLDVAYSSGHKCRSKNCYVDTVSDLSVFADSITGSFKVSLHKRSNGALNSNEVAVNSAGLTTGTLTAVDAGADNYLEIESTGNGTFEGYVILEDNGADRFYNAWAVGKKTTSAGMNADFSKANILYDYWRDARLSLSGNMNGSVETFISTKYNKEQKNIKRYYSTLPNPLHGLFNGTYIAKIDSWERDIETGYIDMTLTYQEDNGNVYLVDDDGELMHDGNGNIIIE